VKGLLLVPPYLEHSLPCTLLPLPPPPGKTTVARLYYRLLKDLGGFSAAQERAQEAKAAAEAAEQRKADAAEAARQDAERRAFQSAGLPYTQSAAKKAPAPAAVAAASLGSWPSGFVETTGAALADNGVRGLKGILDKIRQVGGGVLFVDEVGPAAVGASRVARSVPLLWCVCVCVFVLANSAVLFVRGPSTV